MIVETFSSAEVLAAAATDAVIQALDAGLRLRGAASLAATGGRSPGAIYDALSLAPLDWARVRVTLTDERWVDPSSPDSNEGLVRRRLLRGRAQDAHFLGLRGTADHIEDAADHAADALHGWPPLDVVMLGMGEDGHVASLFPGSPALPRGLDPAAPACIAVPQGLGRPPAQPRLSLTIRPLTQAARVLILTSGAAKRAVLEQALAGGDPLHFPVRAILQSARSARILWTA
jgi:6-phosphogluconolactonase